MLASLKDDSKSTMESSCTYTGYTCIGYLFIPIIGGHMDSKLAAYLKVPCEPRSTICGIPAPIPMLTYWLGVG